VAGLAALVAVLGCFCFSKVGLFSWGGGLVGLVLAGDEGFPLAVLLKRSCRCWSMRSRNSNKVALKVDTRTPQHSRHCTQALSTPASKLTHTSHQHTPHTLITPPTPQPTP
jgi:hypothetical protein